MTYVGSCSAKPHAQARTASDTRSLLLTSSGVLNHQTYRFAGTWSRLRLPWLKLMDCFLDRLVCDCRARTDVCCGSMNGLASRLSGRLRSRYIASGRYRDEEELSCNCPGQGAPEAARRVPSLCVPGQRWA